MKLPSMLWFCAVVLMSGMSGMRVHAGQCVNDWATALSTYQNNFMSNNCLQDTLQCAESCVNEKLSCGTSCCTYGSTGSLRPFAIGVKTGDKAFPIATTCFSSSGSSQAASPAAKPTSSGNPTSPAGSSPSPSPAAKSTDAGSAKSGFGGCIGASTRCEGLEVARVVRLQGKSLRLSNTWRQAQVLCLPSGAGTQVCATHDHIVIAGGVEMTMSQMCLQRSCTRKLDRVANFNDNNPDAVVKCGEFGLTQRTESDFYETRVRSYVESGMLARLLRM